MLSIRFLQSLNGKGHVMLDRLERQREAWLAAGEVGTNICRDRSRTRLG